MQPADYTFELPEALIAQVPLPERSASRLLHATATGGLEDLLFKEFSRLVNPGDLLVLNDTRVVPARLLGHKATGGRVEILLERELEPQVALVQLRASKTPAEGSRIEISDSVGATVSGRQDNFFRLHFDAPVQEILEAHGHMPLPPYIRRQDDEQDRERYQTVFAREPGAVAAPTAGLHFDQGQLNRLRSIGVELGYLTLHVGAGTFQPVREEQLVSGELHAERLQVLRACVARLPTRAMLAVGSLRWAPPWCVASRPRLRPVSCKPSTARRDCSFARVSRSRSSMRC